MAQHVLFHRQEEKVALADAKATRISCGEPQGLRAETRASLRQDGEGQSCFGTESRNACSLEDSHLEGS